VLLIGMYYLLACLVTRLANFGEVMVG
jgi:hypothetical protein